MPSAGEDVKKQELPPTAGANAKWCSHARKQFGGVLTAETFTYRRCCCHLPAGILPKRNEDMCSCGNLHTDVHRHFIHNQHKLETTQISPSCRTGQEWHSRTIEYSLERKKHTPLIDTSSSALRGKVTLSERSHTDVTV